MFHTAYITVISPNFLVWKLCLSTKFPLQEISWNYGILNILTWGIEGCIPPLSLRLDNFEFTGAKILLAIFLNFVKQELFSSNVNEIKNPER